MRSLTSSSDNCFVTAIPFQRYSVVVPDNASIHRSPRVEQMCSDAGVLKINTAPFGPWKNAIEQHFGELKTFVEQYWPLFESDPELDFAAYLRFVWRRWAQEAQRPRSLQERRNQCRRGVTQIKVAGSRKATLAARID